MKTEVLVTPMTSLDGPTAYAVTLVYGPHRSRRQVICKTIQAAKARAFKLMKEHKAELYVCLDARRVWAA